MTIALFLLGGSTMRSPYSGYNQVGAASTGARLFRLCQGIALGGRGRAAVAAVAQARRSPRLVRHDPADRGALGLILASALCAYFLLSADRGLPHCAALSVLVALAINVLGFRPPAPGRDPGVQGCSRAASSARRHRRDHAPRMRTILLGRSPRSPASRCSISLRWFRVLGPLTTNESLVPFLLIEAVEPRSASWRCSLAGLLPTASGAARARVSAF